MRASLLSMACLAVACSDVGRAVYVANEPGVVMRTLHPESFAVGEYSLVQDAITVFSYDGGDVTGEPEGATAPTLTASTDLRGRFPPLSLWGAADGRLYARGLTAFANGRTAYLGQASRPVRALVFKSFTADRLDLTTLQLFAATGNAGETTRILGGPAHDSDQPLVLWADRAVTVASSVIDATVFELVGDRAVLAGTGSLQLFDPTPTPPLTVAESVFVNGSAVALAARPSATPTSYFLLTHTPSSVLLCSVAAPASCQAVADLAALPGEPRSLAVTALATGERLHVGSTSGDVWAFAVDAAGGLSRVESEDVHAVGPALFLASATISATALSDRDDGEKEVMFQRLWAYTTLDGSERVAAWDLGDPRGPTAILGSPFLVPEAQPNFYPSLPEGGAFGVPLRLSVKACSEVNCGVTGSTSVD